MQISHVPLSKKEKKDFVKRMVHDVEKRDQRDKTIENLKDNILRS